MTVSVAEYFGQRTDVNETIDPIILKKQSMQCPFSFGNTCKKIKRNSQPVCAVRKDDGTLWITCSERLCSTKKTMPDNKEVMPLCHHQQEILLKIARTIWGDSLSLQDVIVKREVDLKAGLDTDYHADYIIARREEDNSYPGPNRLILEMQGGGETTNTGNISKHLKYWSDMDNPNNEFLREQVNASTLETNAWRRQQEQFIVKGNIAAQTWKGYGLAFCVGTLLFDYIMEKTPHYISKRTGESISALPDLRKHNWTLALIGIKEDTSADVVPGPIPLTIDEDRLLFTNYQTFVHALINQGLPSPDAFTGDYWRLDNKAIKIENM